MYTDKLFCPRNKREAHFMIGILFLYAGFMIQIYTDPILWPQVGVLRGMGNSYTLALSIGSMFSAIFTPIAVKITTILPSKKILIVSSIEILFLYSSQAFIQYLPLLFIARAGIGIGFAFLFTAILKSTGDIISKQHRGFWIGIQGAIMGIISIIIPPITGWLLDHNQITFAFFLAGPCYITGLLFLKKYNAPQNIIAQKVTVKWINAILICIALGSFFIFTSKENFHFSETESGFILGICGIAAIFTFLLEKRAGENAIIPLKIWRDKNHLLITLSSFTAAASGTFLYYSFAYYMLTYMNTNATEAGIAIGLQFLITLFIAPLFGKHLYKSSTFHRSILFSGILMVGIYLWLALYLNVNTPLFTVNITMILFGIYAMVISVIYSYAAQNFVSEEQRPYTIGGYKLATSLGYSIPLSIYTIILNAQAANPELGYDILYLISIGLTILTIILTIKIKATS